MGTAIVVSVGWILSLCLHEFGHALVAYIGGDKSVKEKGYLTLNPLRYTDPGLTLVVPLLILMIGGIALPGAAVYINKGNLRNRLWQSAVSAAGPAFNLVVLLAVAAPFQLGLVSDPNNWLWASMALLALLQTMAILLNLLPVPPLDGYGIIEPWLPGPLRQAAASFGRYGIWVLFGALWLFRPANELLWDTADSILSDLGVSPDLAQAGFMLFQQQRFLLMGFILVVLAITNRGRGRNRA